MKQCLLLIIFLIFFFDVPGSAVVNTLSLHDALPIFVDLHLSDTGAGSGNRVLYRGPRYYRRSRAVSDKIGIENEDERSEEHTSELQSQSNLVCRLLLEKKIRDIDSAAVVLRA